MAFVLVPGVGKNWFRLSHVWNFSVTKSKSCCTGAGVPVLHSIARVSSPVTNPNRIEYFDSIVSRITYGKKAK
jgi:hypothetical protein